MHCVPAQFNRVFVGSPAYAAHMGTQEPGYPSAAWQPTPPRRWLTTAIVAVTAAAALAIGVAVGAVLSDGGNSSAADTIGPVVTNESAAETSSSTPSAAEVHAQDVALCTRYAVVNTTQPRTDRRALDILPAAAALENALVDNPHANTSVRAAIADVVSVYYARIAAYGEVRTRGLAEPPTHDLVNEQAAYDQVWTVCGLDEE